MNIAAILHEQAARHGSRTAIVERGRSIAFDALDRAAASAAASMSVAGLRPGMRALVFSPMSIDLYITIIGMFRLRVTAVFADPSAGMRRLGACVDRVRPGAFVAVPKAHLLRLMSPAIRSVRIKMAVGGRIPFAPTVAVGSRDAVTTVEPCDDGTPAIITFTSGSTGEPKAAVRSHGFLIAQHRALAESLSLSSGEVDLTTLPIFLLANLASGVTSVIPDADLRAPGAIDPGPVLRQIASAGVTRTVASPALLERIAARAARDGIRLERMQRVYTGGAPVFPVLLDALADVAPRAAVVAVYGSTEAEPIAEIDRREISAADLTAMAGGAGLLAGRPAPSIALRVLPDRWGTPLGPWTPADLARETLAAGSIGELAVCGDHVLTGYLDGDGDRESKLRIGDRVWHRTGDAGYLDVQGRLWLMGRCAAKISDSEGTVYPFAVECAASGVPGVRRTAFVQHHGRRVLVAEMDSSASSGARQALRDRTAWARVADVLVVPRIPVDRRHNAKVDYPGLRALLDKLEV